MSNVVNLFLDQGCDYYRTISIIDNIQKFPLNLSNYTIKGQIRKNYTSTSNVNFDIVIIDAINGKISIGLDKTKTQLLSEIKYMYDIKITSPDTRCYKVLEGVITCTPSITK